MDQTIVSGTKSEVKLCLGDIHVQLKLIHPIQGEMANVKGRSSLTLESHQQISTFLEFTSLVQKQKSIE